MYMPFLCPRYHKAPQIDEKASCYRFEKHTVSKFIARNQAFYRLTLYTDWLTLGHMTPVMSYPIATLYAQTY